MALRYKCYTDIPVIFITDDRSLSNKASGEGLEVWTSKDFLTPPESPFGDEAQVMEGAKTVVTSDPSECTKAMGSPVAEINEQEK